MRHRGFNFCSTSSLLTPIVPLPSSHGFATSTPVHFLPSVSKSQLQGREDGESPCRSKPQTWPLKANVIFQPKDFFFSQFIFRTMVKHTNPGGLKHYPAVLVT